MTTVSKTCSRCSFSAPLLKSKTIRRCPKCDAKLRYVFVTAPETATGIEKTPHASNHIPKDERIKNTVFSVLLIIYGSCGIYGNDLYIPGKRGRGVHLHNGAAWLMFGALISCSLFLLSVVVDHYDTRNNETNYRFFANVTRTIGWILFALSLILHASHSTGFTSTVGFLICVFLLSWKYGQPTDQCPKTGLAHTEPRPRVRIGL
ncbi:MAG: hypothetical protein JWL63_3289 [Rhodocyclales bacterium]|nr:hypothetical protein [Rhodocyclales bacterium]